MRLISIACAALVLIGASTGLGQGIDPDSGRNLAATCANCHGTNGVAAGASPSLAGQSRRTTSCARCRTYKAGASAGTIMPQLAKGYTDAQIELAAGWFAAQKGRR